jgi:hypothetical protein
MDLFLKHHSDLAERDYSAEQPFTTLWHHLQIKWSQNNPTKGNESTSSSKRSTSSQGQRLQILDLKIRETLQYQQERDIEIAYATAVNGEIESRLKAPAKLHDSANCGNDWRVDVTARDIMDRFKTVIATADKPGPADDDDVNESGENDNPGGDVAVLAKMRAAMEAAYHRYLYPWEAEAEARMVGVPDEDDDSTEDFMDVMELGDENEDGESSSDTLDNEDESGSEEDDLDVEELLSDRRLNIEAIREQLANMERNI